MPKTCVKEVFQQKLHVFCSVLTNVSSATNPEWTTRCLALNIWTSVWFVERRWLIKKSPLSMLGWGRPSSAWCVVMGHTAWIWTNKEIGNTSKSEQHETCLNKSKHQHQPHGNVEKHWLVQHPVSIGFTRQQDFPDRLKLLKEFGSKNPFRDHGIVC